jgi:hypothetical protein
VGGERLEYLRPRLERIDQRRFGTITLTRTPKRPTSDASPRMIQMASPTLASTMN